MKNEEIVKEIRSKLLQADELIQEVRDLIVKTELDISKEIPIFSLNRALSELRHAEGDFGI